MISVNEAADIILKSAGGFPIKTVPFREALGAVLAVPIYTDRDLPPYDRVTMDGIAVRFDDVISEQRTLRLKGTVAAGAEQTKLSEKGVAYEIMTGSPVPVGADTIIRYEDISIEGDQITILNAPKEKGENIHFRGSDKQEGEMLAPAGIKIDPNVIAVAAASGHTTLKIFQLPSVAIFSSGDELVDVDQKPLPHQIRQSNAYALEGWLKQIGISADIYLLDDDKEKITLCLHEIVEKYDIMIMTGGVSLGKFDHIPGVLDDLGIQKHFHKVAQRPGKPFWFGSKEGIHVFALPGNPVSTTLCMIRYVLPWFRNNMNSSQVASFKVKLGKSIRFTKPLNYFVQSILQYDNSGQCWAFPVPDNGSGDFSSLVGAHGFVDLLPDRDDFPEGLVVDFYPF